MIKISERWLQRCQRNLEQIKNMESMKDRDRLQLVHTMLFSLGALRTSLSGWIQWINNPSITTRFKQEELEEMNKTITDFVKSFIEYDIKITRKGIEKGIKERRQRRREREVRGPPDSLVV